AGSPDHPGQLRPCGNGRQAGRGDGALGARRGDDSNPGAGRVETSWDYAHRGPGAADRSEPASGGDAATLCGSAAQHRVTGPGTRLYDPRAGLTPGSRGGFRGTPEVILPRTQ